MTTRWNQILIILSAIVFIDVIFILKEDFSHQNFRDRFENGAGLIPSKSSQLLDWKRVAKEKSLGTIKGKDTTKVKPKQKNADEFPKDKLDEIIQKDEPSDGENPDNEQEQGDDEPIVGREGDNDPANDREEDEEDSVNEIGEDEDPVNERGEDVVTVNKRVEDKDLVNKRDEEPVQKNGAIEEHMASAVITTMDNKENKGVKGATNVEQGGGGKADENLDLNVKGKTMAKGVQKGGDNEMIFEGEAGKKPDLQQTGDDEAAAVPSVTASSTKESKGAKKAADPSNGDEEDNSTPKPNGTMHDNGVHQKVRLQPEKENTIKDDSTPPKIMSVTKVTGVTQEIKVQPKEEKVNIDSATLRTHDEEEANNRKDVVNKKKSQNVESAANPGVHVIAGLNCDPHGGPSREYAAEMVYWQDIPTDAQYVSPFKHVGPEPKYLTFEPDEGGWNNIRMSMETAVAMAHATGRILVMPPEQGMYLLHKGEGQKNRFSFTDFFHFQSMAVEHAGIEIISFEEFLNREVMDGQMIDKQGSVTFPPNNRTDWNGSGRDEVKALDMWVRTFATNPIWSFDECMVGFPAEPGFEGPNRLRAWVSNVTSTDQVTRLNEYTGNPVPVDGDPQDRLRENLAHRKRLCIYNEEFQNAKVFHLMGDNKSEARLLVHFYAFLFFEDWRHDLWTKRFVRDHLRYVDEIQCAAARVVKEVRRKSRENGDLKGGYKSFHIRRGDFQYQDTRVAASVIYDNVKDMLKDGETVYIATDERDKSFFAILQEHYKVYFLDDFESNLGTINTNFFGMLDQRIASRGDIFIGCYYSTFTGYINRMRGYHHQLAKHQGWKNGIIPSFYYIPKDLKFAVREYIPIFPPMWAREFPVAWRDLDRGIEDIAAMSASPRKARF